MITTADFCSPARYAEASSNGKFYRPPHIQALDAEVMATLLGDYDILVAMAPPRHGKLLADSTPIWTPSGWKQHGELVEGDYVYSPSGNPVRVIGVGPKSLADLSVTFADGSSIKCHREHEWYVTDRASHRSKKRVETQEILAKPFSGVDKNGNPRARYLIDYCKPLKSVHKTLELDPYVLGVWLGDGKQSGGSFCGSVVDVGLIEAEIARRGWLRSWESIHQTTGVRYVGYKGMYPIIRKLGLSKEKFIPAQYLTASETQRRDILAGLVDTDGSVESGGRTRFVTCSARLAGDVSFLVKTLGYRATTTIQQPHLSTSGIIGKQQVYTVQWSPHDGIPQGRLPRKSVVARCVRRSNSIQSVKPCEPEQGNCIQVEGGLYLVGENLTTTHNSEYLSKWLPSWFTNAYSDKRVIAASYSMSLSRLASRFARDQNHKDAPLWGRGGVNRMIKGATDWQTVDGGGMLAAGVGGGITGRAADLFLIDDCLKNAEQALSETIKQSQWEWWQTTAFTRLEPGGKMILLGTRWASDDLLGKVLDFASKEKSLRVREVRFPAIAELDEGQVDIIGRKNGEALWPQRYSVEALQRIRSAMDDYWWQSLYQQKLTQYGSNEWPESYFWGITCEPEEWPKNFALSATALDPSKGKDSKKGDFQAIVNVAYKSGTLWIECDIDRRPISEMIDTLVSFNERVRPTVTGIESVAFQELLAPVYIQAQIDRAYYDNPQLIENTVSKRIRISRLGYWLRTHRVKIKNNAAGQLLIKQLRAFPYGDHDDGCFAAGTMIETNRGTIPIESVLPGDYVWSRHGWTKVLLSGCTGVRPVSKYYFENGISLLATSGHPVYSEGQFQPISKSRSVMLCQSEDQKQSIPNQFSSMELSLRDTPTRNNGHTGFTSLQTEQTASLESSLYIEKFGKATTDQYQTGCTFTTETAIHSTTQYPISNASLPNNMQTTTKNLSAIVGKEIPCPQKHSKRQPSGTAHLKVENGTNDMPRQSLKTSLLQNALASSAAKHSSAKHHTKQHTADQNAGSASTLSTMALNSDTTIYSANAAEVPSSQKSELQSFARQNASSALLKGSIYLGRMPVYNLTTENSEYAANGIAVHNCDAMEMALRLLLQVCDQLQEIMQMDGATDAIQVLEA